MIWITVKNMYLIESRTVIGTCPHGEEIIHYRDDTPGFREWDTYVCCMKCFNTPPELRPESIRRINVYRGKE